MKQLTLLIFALLLLLLTGCAGDLIVFSDVTYSNMASGNSTAVQVVGDNNSAWAGETPPAAPAPAPAAGRPASDWIGLLLPFGSAMFFIVLCLYVMRIGPFGVKEKYW